MGIDAIELPHPVGEIGFRCFEDQVIVVVHQTIGMAEPVKTVSNLPQALQEGLTISIILEDIVPGIPPGRHMIDRSVKLQPKRARHDRCLYRTARREYKIQDLTLLLLVLRFASLRFAL